MYVPAQFSEERRAVLIEHMRAIRLALFVTHTDGAYHATHAPTVVREEGDTLLIESHFARQNDHISAIGAPTLAVFQGPQAYVSPAWYPSKQAHGNVVPTWNYVAIHAQGMLARLEEEALLAHLAAMTDENEAGRAVPWSVDDAPEGYVPRLARAIVGVRLTVETLTGSFKLLQHKPEADRKGAAAGLLTEPQEGAKTLGAMMAAREESA